MKNGQATGHLTCEARETPPSAQVAAKPWRGQERSVSAAEVPRVGQPTLFFYCQASEKPNDLDRCLVLAQALAAFFRVVVLADSERRPRPDLTTGVELIELPGLNKHDGASATDAHERRVAQVERRLLTELAMRVHRPAVLLVQAFPFGNAPLASEMLPLLRLARGQPGPLAVVACSLLDPGNGEGTHHLQPDHARWLVDRFFDSVLVHADPLLCRLEDVFRPKEPLRTPVHYTGYVQPASARPGNVPRGEHLLVSAGDGRHGEALLRTALQAHALLAEPLPMRIVAGVQFPQARWEALQHDVSRVPGVELVRQAPDMLVEMQRARASISHCEHHAARDILLSAVPALVVTEGAPSQNEEGERATRLAAAGALLQLDAAQVSAARLAKELERLLAFRPRPVSLDLDGATRCAQRLYKLHVAARDASRAGTALA